MVDNGEHGHLAAIFINDQRKYKPAELQRSLKRILSHVREAMESELPSRTLHLN